MRIILLMLTIMLTTLLAMSLFYHTANTVEILTLGMISGYILFDDVENKQKK